MYYSIAIDGPSGAGKSSLAKNLARHIGFNYIDTGAMYRTIGLYVYRKGISSGDAAGIVSCLSEIDIGIQFEDGVQNMYLNGERVTDFIREPDISTYASGVSKIPEVRGFLFDLQRDFARSNCVIMDGRDIGTVILPDADVKIYLFASAENRAQRRYLELCEKGVATTYEEVLEQMRQRDENDANREIAPAKPADDAVMVDNSELGIEGTFERVLEIVRERIAL